MFSLIITIISIALVAVIAIATIYYGGTAFTRGQLDAEAVRYLNESAQIQGALVLYENDHAGATPAAVSDLAPNYLRAVPQGDWAFQDGYYATTVPSEELCVTANKKAGVNLATVPSCSDAAISGYKTVCCTL